MIFSILCIALILFANVFFCRSSSNRRTLFSCVNEIQEISSYGCRNCRKYLAPTRLIKQLYRFCQSERSPATTTRSTRGLLKRITRKLFAKSICFLLTIRNIFYLFYVYFFVCWSIRLPSCMLNFLSNSASLIILFTLHLPIPLYITHFDCLISF